MLWSGLCANSTGPAAMGMSGRTLKKPGIFRCQAAGEEMRLSLVVSAVAAIASVAAGAARADVFTNVPASELAGYRLVYQLAIPTQSPGWNTAGTLAGPS